MRKMGKTPSFYLSDEVLCIPLSLESNVTNSFLSTDFSGIELNKENSLSEKFCISTEKI